MANVTLIYAGRLLASRTALAAYALVVSAAALAAVVSVSNVFANFVNAVGGGVGSTIGFMLSAVTGTTLMVQLALTVGVIATFLLVAPALRARRAFA